MSTDHQDLYRQGGSSNCCGALIMTNGLCSDCGEHCEDEEDFEPSEETKAELKAQFKFWEHPKYRQDMKDAGRGHLLP